MVITCDLTIRPRRTQTYVMVFKVSMNYQRVRTSWTRLEGAEIMGPFLVQRASF